MTLHQEASKRHAVLQRRLRVAELAAQASRTLALGTSQFAFASVELLQGQSGG